MISGIYSMLALLFILGVIVFDDEVTKSESAIVSVLILPIMYNVLINLLY